MAQKIKGVLYEYVEPVPFWSFLILFLNDKALKRVCPVKWRCLKLNRFVEVDKKAICCSKAGWICDCGDWVFDNNVFHHVIRKGLREFG